MTWILDHHAIHLMLQTNPDGRKIAEDHTFWRKFAYWNDYSPEQAIGLYPTDGTSDEHAYGHLGVASYCFEG